jgi:membrane associated rhomboid family serine protease
MSELPEKISPEIRKVIPQSQPMFQVPAVVLFVISLLIFIHAGLSYLGEDWKITALYLFSLIPARFGSDPIAQYSYSAYWSFLTHGFLHGSWAHLFSNSIWMLIFSTVVAKRIGSWRYLLLCGVATVAGGLLSFAFHWEERIILIGASSAVAGVMAAAIPIMFAKNLGIGRSFQENLSRIKVLRPIEIMQNPRALAFMLIWFALTLLTGAVQSTGVALIDEGQIAWEAHIGGFIAGLVTFYILDRGSALPNSKL